MRSSPNWSLHWWSVVAQSRVLPINCNGYKAVRMFKPCCGFLRY